MDFQSINYDFAVSNFIGTGVQPFTNNLSKLKYSGHDLELKTLDNSSSFKLVNNGSYKLIDGLYNYNCQITRLDYNYNKLSQYFKINNSSNIVFIIERKSNGIKCTIGFQGTGLPPSGMVNYYKNKIFYFQLNGYGTTDFKNLLESENIRQINDNIYYKVGVQSSILNRVKVLSPHVFNYGQDHYRDFINSKSGWLLAINSCYVNSNNTINFSAPVIKLSISNANVNVIDLKTTSSPNGIKSYCVSNVELLGNDKRTVKVSAGENCLSTCKIFNQQTNLNIPSTFISFNIYYIAIEKQSGLTFFYPPDWCTKEVSVNNLNDDIQLCYLLTHPYYNNQRMFTFELKEDDDNNKYCNVKFDGRAYCYNIDYNYVLTLEDKCINGQNIKVCYLKIISNDDNSDNVLLYAEGDFKNSRLYVKKNSPMANDFVPSGFSLNNSICHNNETNVSTNDFYSCLNLDTYSGYIDLLLYSSNK